MFKWWFTCKYLVKKKISIPNRLDINESHYSEVKGVDICRRWAIKMFERITRSGWVDLGLKFLLFLGSYLIYISFLDKFMNWAPFSQAKRVGIHLVKSNIFRMVFWHLNKKNRFGHKTFHDFYENGLKISKKTLSRNRFMTIPIVSSCR